MNGVSVVICCYNSTLKLPETLSYLARQQTSADLHYEILVIDNASTDGTSDTANTCWATFNNPVPLRTIYEKQPGKNYAIEKGIETALFDLILFCDDDNLLHPDYIQTGFDYFQQYPTLGLLGGKGIPRLPAGVIPEWFERYAFQYALGAQAPATSDITVSNGFVYGAGSFLKKNAFLQLKETGFQYTLAGRKNGLILPGEDNELGYALSLLGYSIHYTDVLVFTHVLSAGRLTWPYIKRLKRAVAYSTTLLTPYQEYRKKYLLHIPFSFSWINRVLLHMRYFLTDLIRYPFASNSFKADIRLDIQTRIGSLEALFIHRRYLGNKDLWLPWFQKQRTVE